MGRFKHVWLILALFCSYLLCIGSLNAAPVNLVQNGSFESGSYTTSNPDFNTLNAPSSAITGWTVISPTGGNIDWVGTYWKAADGTHSIDLNGSTIGFGGGIQQTINTTANQQYKLTFSVAANPDAGPSVRPMMVLGIGSTLFDIPLIALNSEATRTDMKWASYEYIFTAGFSSTVLTFLSQTMGYYGPAIDNVGVSAVPLPAAAWMLGAGLVGLVAIRRRKTT